MIENKRDIIKNLIYLSGRTISGSALEAGIDPANLSRYLKGHQTTVSDSKIHFLCESILGLDPDLGILLPKVHTWLVSGKIRPSDLSSLVDQVLPGGGTIYAFYFDRQESKIPDMGAFERGLVLSSGGTRVKILQPFGSFFSKTRLFGEAFEGEVFDKWVWKSFALNDKVFKRLTQETLSVNEIDRLFDLEEKEKNFPDYQNMTNAELLSLIVGYTLDTPQDIDFRKLIKMGLNELSQRLGVNLQNAKKIQSALELSKRISKLGRNEMQ